MVFDNQNDTVGVYHYWSHASRDGVRKVPSVNFSIKEIFDFAKILVRFFASLSYLTGATTAELRRHL